MSTRGQFNTKSPTIKRILREAAEISTTPSPDYYAAPIETNLFEWHFILRGPPSPSPYANGLYHGRIVLPPTYPLRPPSFRFLTPTGRFETNREICLSISGHHEETWQPAWGIRTALVALRSFMDQEAKGQVGGLDTEGSVRKRLARESRQWSCSSCGGRSNESIIREVEIEAAAFEERGDRQSAASEVVPAELQLGYREEIESKSTGEGVAGASASSPEAPENMTQLPVIAESEPSPRPTLSISEAVRPRIVRNRTEGRTPVISAQATVPSARIADDGIPAWLDRAIGLVVIGLIFFILKKMLGL